jgi:hypothetical protein
MSASSIQLGGVLRNIPAMAVGGLDSGADQSDQLGAASQQGVQFLEKGRELTR